MVLLEKNPPANAGELRDAGSIRKSGRSPGGGHGNPLQYSCLENPKDRGAWRATVHGAARSRTQLSMHAPTPWLIKEMPKLGNFPNYSVEIHMIVTDIGKSKTKLYYSISYM